MTELKLFNSLTRRVEPFAPIDPPRVRMYCCGPTVYNVAHIGNFRAYVFEDILRRTLSYAGYRVEQVMNLTDVDDKTIRGAREAGVTLDAFTRPFKEAFFADLRTLAIEPAERYPAATEHVPQVIELVAQLLARGLAYRSDDGSVYFSIAAFPNYGRLARLDTAGLRAGARVAHDEYDKENVADFALWKAWDADDGAVAWDAPWGRGRPGWHVECSAMSMHYLGATFDLHTGGIDNLFPHHDNEIAQSEGASGKPFVRVWMHCEHLRVDGRKMSKSLGNVYTLRAILDRGYTGREIRYVLLAGHYRQELNFTFAALDAARAALARIDEFRERLRATAAGTEPGETPGWAREGRLGFEAALGDDLGMPGALAALFETIHGGHREMDAARLSPPAAAAALAHVDELDRVLGLIPPRNDEPDEAVTTLARQRQAARTARDWAAADRLRAAIAAAGWDVRDTPNGPVLRRRA